MGKVTALMMDVITEASGHQVVPNAVSVCITPCAPSPVPIPYPVIANVSEGITDPPLRTKVSGEKFATTGSVLKACHGNEAGTLKETCSLNTGGPVFIIMGAPTVISELGMMGITGALCISNKAITVGAGGSASDASGTGGPAGGGGGGGAGGPGPDGPGGASNGGGGGGGSNSGASASSPSPGGRGAGADGPPGTASGPAEQHQCQNGHPVDMATGYVVDQALDFELPGLIPFVFHRRYSSGRNHDTRAGFGPGWAHGWEMNVGEADRSIVLRDGEGRSICFEKIAVGGKTFHRGERMELTRLAADRYEIFHLTSRFIYRFEADAPGGIADLRHVRDGFDNRVELSYEGGRMVAARDTAGREIVFSWLEGRIRRVEVRIGGASELRYEYDYNERGLLIAVTDPLGHTETCEYDGQARMSATTLKTGITFRYEYELDTGRCKRTWGPKGLYDLVFSADLPNHLTFADGEEPRTYTIDDHEHVTREATPSGAVLEERAYDDDGYLIAEVNGAGEGTQYWYDARGNLVRRVDATGAVTAWDYDEHDLCIRRTTPDGLAFHYQYGVGGALASAVFPTGQAYTLSSDSRGRLVRVDDKNGPVSLIEYDGAHNTAGVTNAMGAKTTYHYDALGRATQRTDPLGHVTRLVRDRLGRITTHLMPDHASVRRSYDPRGNIAEEVDPLGRVTKYAYAGIDKLVHVETADKGTWRLKYTTDERLLEVKNPKGEAYGFRYDEGGRLVGETAFDGRSLEYKIGASGRVDEIVYADKSKRAFSYDRAGRLTGDDGSDGSSIAFKRDRVGRVVEATLLEQGRKHVTVFERDAFGRVVREHQGDQTLSYAFDAFGQIVERTLPDGTKTQYVFDRTGELTRVTHAGKAFDLGRDAVGQEIAFAPESRRFVFQSRFDPVGRIIEQVARTPKPGGELGDSFFRRTFKYDRAGQLDRVTDDRWGMVDYRHDAVGQLSSAVGSSHLGRLESAFQYDPAGSLVNVLERSDRGAASEAKPWKIGPGNVLLETPTRKYANDKRGRRIGERDLTQTEGAERVTEYSWDVRDRMREARLPDGKRVVYDYDALGRRIGKRVFEGDSPTPARSMAYTWSGPILVSERSSDRALRNFVHRPGTFEPLLHEERGEVFFYVLDQVGVPRELLDEGGRVAWSGRFSAWGALEEEYVDPYRVQSGRAVTTPFRLLGQVYDEETGLAWTRFRCWDAGTGRWMSPDPLGLGGGVNLFGFDGSPLANVDEWGLTGAPHIVEHQSEAAARRAALRDANIPVGDPGRHAITQEESRPGSKSPMGDPGMRTEIRDSALPQQTAPAAHHDPFGHRIEDKNPDGSTTVTTIPPHWGVDRPGGGTIHHTYPSDHDPNTNR